MKTNLIFKSVLTLLALTLTSLNLSAQSAQSSNYVEPTLTYMEKPIFPYRQISNGVIEGSVTFIVELDNSGHKSDWLAIGATDRDFVDAIGIVIDKWTFTPAYRDGKPVASAMTFTITFKIGDSVLSATGMQFASTFLYGNYNKLEKPLVVRYSDLDVLPRPREIVQPTVGSDVPAEAASGEVEMAFIIDDKGNVRMPVLLSCRGDIRLAYAAYDALLKWKFDAPKAHGMTTMVRAQQKFIFTAAKKAPAPASKK